MCDGAFFKQKERARTARTGRLKPAQKQQEAKQWQKN